MIKSKNSNNGDRPENALYNSDYYENYNGASYGRNSQWLQFFGNIADNIIDTINPETVLDVGCAYGLLVEALRDRNCEAYGIDVSEHALSNSRSDIRPFLNCSSILEPLNKKFDLIVSVEVIEHIKEVDCDILIGNMCDAADKILISSIPDDFDDPTHFNVQPPTYWVKKFSEFGFEPVINYDAGYLTPYAILFRKSKKTLNSDIHSLFGEKKFQDLLYSRIRHERNLLKVEVNEEREKSAILEKRKLEQAEVIVKSNDHVKNLEQQFNAERLAREYYENLFLSQSASLSWRLTRPLRSINRAIYAFRPWKAKDVFEGNIDEDIQIFNPNLPKWALIELSEETSPDFHFAVTMVFNGDIIRLPILELSRPATRCLVRINPLASSMKTRVLRGYSSRLKISQISACTAWRLMVLDKLYKAKDLKTIFSLTFRFSRSLWDVGLGNTLNKAWPTMENLDNGYERWLLAFDSPNHQRGALNWLESLSYRPCISIILPVYNSNIDYLSKAVRSVEAQSYTNWQLCIIDDGSTDKAVAKFLDNYTGNERILIKYSETNSHISEASNVALKYATGEFVTFLDHDDELHTQALATVVSYLNETPKADFLYSDEDKIDEHGIRKDPFFKPDWNPDLLLSQNYICHLAVYRTSILKNIGGLRKGVEGAQDYDLVLRFTEETNNIVHIPHVLYHWRSVKGSTALAGNEKDYAHARAVKVLENALVRRGIKATVGSTGLGAFHRISYSIPAPNPLVSIIIPTRDQVSILKNCLEGLLYRTDYPAMEIIIIDNDSTENETKEFFKELEPHGVHILCWSGAFNFSSINNFGVQNAKGEVIVLLNNDIEVIDGNWLTELVSHAVRPGIGVVGARLYYPDNRVQHDGIIVGMGGVAGYAHPLMDREKSGDFGRSRVIQNYSAVTAAACAVKKSIYDEVGGLDETNLTVAFNDVDFCLRVQKAGYRNVYTPYAELYHHESISRGPDTTPEKAKRFEKEALYMMKAWEDEIKSDTCYNVNLSLQSGFELDLHRGKLWPWNAN